jgi:hypothetical protein
MCAGSGRLNGGIKRIRRLEVCGERGDDQRDQGRIKPMWPWGIGGGYGFFPAAARFVTAAMGISPWAAIGTPH